MSLTLTPLPDDLGADPEHETLQIIGAGFAAAILLDDRRIVWRTAPIVHYMLGWTEAMVIDYCHKRAWEIRGQ